MGSEPILRAQYLLGPLGLMRAQLWAPETNAYGQHCAIGMARRAMAPLDFKLVGPAIHLALPEFFKTNCQLI